METFRIGKPGEQFEPLTQAKCWYEVEVSEKEIKLIERGGPLEYVKLHIVIQNGKLVVEDYWS